MHALFSTHVEILPNKLLFAFARCCRPCPTAPQNVKATFASIPPECDDDVIVTWEPPLQGRVTQYAIVCTNGKSSVDDIVNGNVTSATLGPLETPLVEYICYVFAISESGYGAPGISNPFITL